MKKRKEKTHEIVEVMYHRVLTGLKNIMRDA